MPTKIITFSIISNIAVISLYIALLFLVKRWHHIRWGKTLVALFLGASFSIVISIFGINFFESRTQNYFTLDGIKLLRLSYFAPFIEELSKVSVVYAIIKIFRIKSPVMAMIYAAFVGMGFSFSENLIYFFSIYQEQGIFTWLKALFIRGPISSGIHSSTCIIFAYTYCYCLKLNSFSRSLITSFCVVGLMILHAFWNALNTIGGINQEIYLRWLPFLLVPALFGFIYFLFEFGFALEEKKLKPALKKISEESSSFSILKLMSRFDKKQKEFVLEVAYQNLNKNSLGELNSSVEKIKKQND